MTPSSSKALTLTDEQRAIARHTRGPAVVRAVAGAGKTTVLLHRIRHLVHTEGIRPDRILACSFNRATVSDVNEGLQSLNVDGVTSLTLHALGLKIIQRAPSEPLDVDPTQKDAPSPETQAYLLARRAVADFAAERDLEPHELDVAPQDLVDQVAAWKQQLAYPTRVAPDLPPRAESQAHQATHENQDYVDMYRRFERHRREEGWLTYPDMVMTAWEWLHRDASFRTEVQDAHDFVLVDEFQDISRAQFLLLDLLTACHRNYMAIGDEDQCIYAWRGAQPSFLLDFPDRYNAEEYLLTDSFRSRASQLVLANAILDQNGPREKRLHLTQGFGGSTRVLTAESPSEEATQLARRVSSLHEEGHPLADLTVLVRTYAQTPPMERAFLEADLPHRIVGHQPFYRRRPVQTLLRYLYWATLEDQCQEHGWFDERRTAERYLNRFTHVLKTPTRYVAHARIDLLRRQALERETSALDVLSDHLPDLPDRTAERVRSFLDVAQGLVDRLDTAPDETLEWLIEHIDYEDWLREQSPTPERGTARIRTVRALVRYAEAYSNAPALLDQIHSLAAGESEAQRAPPLEIRSIHRAKGAEWPVVIVPGCNDGSLPFEHGSDPATERSLAEERRLFYVAVTRAREHLLLSTHDPSSARFLREAHAEPTLKRCRRIRTALRADPEVLSETPLVHLCRDIGRLKIDRYIRDGWSPSTEQRTIIWSRLREVKEEIEAAKADLRAYEEAQDDYEAARTEAQKQAREEASALKRRLGTAPIRVKNERPDDFYPEDALFTFKWNEEAQWVEVFEHEDHVGTLDPLGESRLSADQILSLPWSSLVATFEGVERGRQRLRLSIDWTETTERLVQDRTADVDAPEPPSDKVEALTSEAFRRGYEALCSAVAPDSAGP